jgi:hypothetical protein
MRPPPGSRRVAAGSREPDRRHSALDALLGCEFELVPAKSADLPSSYLFEIRRKTSPSSVPLEPLVLRCTTKASRGTGQGSLR